MGLVELPFCHSIHSTSWLLTCPWSSLLCYFWTIFLKMSLMSTIEKIIDYLLAHTQMPHITYKTIQNNLLMHQFLSLVLIVIVPISNLTISIRVLPNIGFRFLTFERFGWQSSTFFFSTRIRFLIGVTISSLRFSTNVECLRANE